MENSEFPSKTKSITPILHAIGFEIEDVSPHRVTGSIEVNETCCQRFRVLNGGVSALISETLASVGAHMASGFKRVAGIQLSINHLKTAELGDLVIAEARPVVAGRTVQVWEVKLWKIQHKTPENRRIMISSSRVTILSDMAIPENAKDAADPLKKFAKL